MYKNLCWARFVIVSNHVLRSNFPNRYLVKLICNKIEHFHEKFPVFLVIIKKFGFYKV